MQQLKLSLLIVFCCQLSTFKNVFGQTTPYLERLVTINATNQPIAEVFKTISTQTTVVFSYTKFNDKQTVTVSYDKKPLSLLLDDLLTKLNCGYTIKDKYIILRCEGKKKSPAVTPATLTGYLYNAVDSSKIASASIYIKQNRYSTVSNEYGFFSISYPATPAPVHLTFAKEAYLDTTVIINDNTKREAIVYLKPLQQKKDSTPVLVATAPVNVVDTAVSVMEDTTSLAQILPKINFWERFKKMNANFRNINDTLFSRFSLTLLPYISTNKLLSINTVNKYALTLLVGNSKGVSVAEVAGLINIDNGNVNYFQVGGLGSIVSGNVKGVQVGGLFNTNSKATTGFQAGGLYNYSNSFKGVQVGGLVNSVKKNTTGVQIGGLVNYTDSLDGIQIAGISNTARKKVDGVQIGGIANYAGTVKGVQLAGLFNTAREVEGYQFSGLINRTKKLHGVQLSFLNFSDTCAGVPIGFLSFVKKGYHKIELSTDELLFTTIGFRIGVEKLHNIVYSGVSLVNQSRLWTYGYGLGSTFTIKNKWKFTGEVTAQQLQNINNQSVSLNLLNKVVVGIEYQLRPKFSIAVAPTYNVLVSSDNNADVAEIHSKISSFYLYRNSDDSNVRMWAGAKLSLKFL